MKRRIVFEQLNKLSQTQREKLKKWWQPEEADVYYRFYEDGTLNDIKWLFRTHLDGVVENYRERQIPALDIAQMIAFLQDQEVDITYRQGRSLAKCELTVNGKTYQAVELCDALFEAVKAIL